MKTNNIRFTSLLPGELTGRLAPQNLEQAAGDFEALFLRDLIQQMRKASDVLSEDNPFNSKQQQLLRDFYDDALASCLASQRSSGIAELIITQLRPLSRAVKD